MELDKLTERSKGFLQAAHTIALREHNQQVTPDHLLKALMDDPEGLCAKLIAAAGGEVGRVRDAVNTAVERLPKVDGAGQLFWAPALGRVIDQAGALAEKAGDSFITVERLLTALALTQEGGSRRLLADAGVNPQNLEAAVRDLRKGRKADSASAEDGYDALAKYARNLTEDALAGRLDPVIGRDEEIRRTIQVLSRRTKNNPVLIGEPGVGKTAVIEGLAQRIVRGDVPESLRDKQLMSLDLGAMVAGAKFRGEFEERLKAVLAEISEAAGGIVLFIDELHTLIGAGAAEGAMDASNLLKPALARGELHCVGATTLDEYRKHVEKDAALARRFQTVFVGEPTVPDTISILRGIKEKYELHHGVRIADGALVSAATLSDRYITDRFLPDKAIDLMDEAASRLRMEVDSKPEALDEMDRRIIQLKIEREALRRETDSGSKDRLLALEGELEELEATSADLTARWRRDKDSLAGATKLKEQLEQARVSLDAAKRDADWAEAGRLEYGLIPELEQQLAQAESEDGQGTVNEVVTEETIATVVSRWTGIPVDRMLAGEKEKLLSMELSLGRQVVGQEEAITAVSHAIRRSRAGLGDPNRPIGSFLFLGPTGVGKTELTKALAAFLFDDEQALLRVDMSEYMEKHAVARLIGAPPGYVGYDEGGSLTEAVRRRPYQVILFDEVEKAHPDVFNILLQVLDDGRLTDGQGRTVDFRNTLIVLTSNLGAELLAAQEDGQDSSALRGPVMDIVRSSFRPEFLNRLDEVLLFHRLFRDHMVGIVDIQMARLTARLFDRKIILELDQAARQWLADRGYDPVYGARPLKRVIQRMLENPLAERLLDGRIGDGDTIQVSVVEDRLALNGERLLADAA